MHRYLPTIPWIVQKMFPRYVWRMPTTEKIVYLTFDDGPEPDVTPWVLDYLRRYNAKATFFCIGENVQRYPDIYNRILAEGHAVGNHTQHHPNGWQVSTEAYVNDVKEATAYVQSSLFRPPYGRIRNEQAKKIWSDVSADMRIIMWDVLSADFDPRIPKEECLRRVLRYVRGGSIVVFHDSQRAFKNLEYALPKVLDYLHTNGYLLDRIVI